MQLIISNRRQRVETGPKRKPKKNANKIKKSSLGSHAKRRLVNTSSIT
jgi:hypothetical protein